MKVCLIRPPFVVANDSIYNVGSTGISQGPSIGLALIAASLKENNHNVMAIDCLGEGLEQFTIIEDLAVTINGKLIEDIIEQVPQDIECFGVTMMFSMEWFYYEKVVQCLKQKFPKIPIVVGGEHISAEYMNALTLCPAIDYCVIGEGEITFIELLHALENNVNLKTIKGIAFRDLNKVIVTEKRTRINNLDDLPIPHWDIFPVENYLNAKASQSATNKRSLPILTSRGCPYSCSFCSNEQMWGTELYLRSPEKIIAEIEYLKGKYQIEHLDICDPVGILNKRWALSLLTKLKEAKLNLTWLHGAGTRSEILDEEMLNLFITSGAQRINYAPESGSKTELLRMNKALSLPRITRSIRLAKQKGLVIRTHIMYGSPNQSFKEILETYIFVLKLTVIGVDDIIIHLFSSHPGTQDFENLKINKKINMQEIIASGNYSLFLLEQSYGKTRNIANFSSPLFTATLPLIQSFTYLSHYGLYFILRPWNIITTVRRSLIEKKPVSALENVIFRIYKGLGGKQNQMVRKVPSLSNKAC